MSDVRARLAEALRGHQRNPYGQHDGWWECSCSTDEPHTPEHMADVLLSLEGVEIVQWREIPGYPGYRVSDSGAIQSFKHATPRYLNGGLALGYPTVSITREDGAQRHVRVHTAVMLAFVGPPPEGMEVRHLDGNPLNSRLSNLAYGTSSENKYDTVRHGTQHDIRKTHCPQGHPYIGPNLIVAKKSDGSQYRLCRECKNQKERRRYRQRRTAADAAEAVTDA